MSGDELHASALREAIEGAEEAARDDIAATSQPEALNGTAEPTVAWQAEVSRLAAMPGIAYDRERDAAAERLGCRVGTLDKEVARVRGEAQPDEAAPGTGRVLRFAPPELHPDPVPGAELLAELAATFGRFLALPGHADVACALWVLHAHAFTASPITPRLAITSPEKRCGKTTLLELVGALVPKPQMAGSITAAAVFRTIELCRPTLLIDEADTFLGENEELRGVLNSGHRRSGEVIRVRERDGEMEPVAFSTWAPVAIAMIGKLPGTLEDRSVQVPMRRRAAGETVERWRCDRLERFVPLVRRCARWAADHLARLREAEPRVPNGLHDRAADNWRPLLAIADAVGGEWPERARAAALALSGSDEAHSYGTMLLEDIRGIFAERGDPEQLASSSIVTELAKLEHRPWGEISKGKAITTTKLASLLAKFGIKPKHERQGNVYQREAFTEAWSRYLAPHEGDQPFTPSQSQQLRGFRADPNPSQRPSQDGMCEGLEEPRNPQKRSVREGVKGSSPQEPPPDVKEWRI